MPLSLRRARRTNTSELVIAAFDKRDKPMALKNEMSRDLDKRKKLNICVDQLLKLAGHPSTVVTHIL